MPRNTVLTYHKARRQWRKKRKIDGKDRYFYLGRSAVNKTDVDAYAFALAEWQGIESQLNADATREGLDRLAKTDEARRLLPHFNALNQFASELAEAGSGVSDAYATRLSEEAAHAGLADHPDFKLDARIVARASLTQRIDTHVKRFLAAYRAQVILGDRSISRYDGLRTHLECFAKWIPPGRSTRVGDLPINIITASMLTDYHAVQVEQISDGKISHYTGHHRLQTLRQFTRWAWEQELVGLPRNIDSRMVQIAVPTKNVNVWTSKQVQRLLLTASERTQLYLLLAANCGMAQVDIAELKRNEVHLIKGTITRVRSKTGHHDGVPTVTYKLWPATLALLKKFKAPEGELMLLNTQGGPLLETDINAMGKMTKRDAIHCAMNRLMKKVNMQTDDNGHRLSPIKGSFKTLRATSANLIELHKRFKPVAGLFLGHTPSSTKDRHYVTADTKLLWEATTWLGRELGVIR